MIEKTYMIVDEGTSNNRNHPVHERQSRHRKIFENFAPLKPLFQGQNENKERKISTQNP